MEKTPDYDHTLEDSLLASGVVEETLKEKDENLNKKLQSMYDDDSINMSMSMVTEEIEKTFSPREMAFLLANSMIKKRRNPAIDLLEKLARASKE